MRPKIYAKSLLSIAEAEVKRQIGCDGIEIQLFDEFLDDKFKYDINDFNYPVTVVHCPILNGEGINLEDLLIPEKAMLIQKSMKLANDFGIKQNKNILVVIHTSKSIEFIKREGDYEKVLDLIAGLLKQYPKTILAIENVTPIKFDSNNNPILCNGFYDDNVAWAKAINTIFPNRAGTVLDVCHAGITKMQLQHIPQLFDLPNKGMFSLSNYFRINKDLCVLIHLASFEGCGYGKGKHGITFTEDTADKCNMVLFLYDNYGYKCPITLEIWENDYMVCDGYRQTKEIVDKYLWYSDVLKR